MAWAEALILGVLQGFTEFLPVSSSGHLVIARSLMPDLVAPGVLFEVLVHVGTLGAVFVAFRREIAELMASLTPGGDPAQRKLALVIAAACVPTALIGFLFQDFIRGLFASPAAAGGMLLVTGVLLWLSEKLGRENYELENLGLGRGIGIGVVQGLAIMPGISRSGATIAAAKLMGVRGLDAARFSFLISIPAILGAATLEATGIEAVEPQVAATCLIGAGAAFVSGLWALQILLAVVRRARLHWFALYCWALGITVLAIEL